MKKAISMPLYFIFITMFYLSSTNANAHAEHDKARFVSSKGKNTGDCSNRFRPCKTIEYARQFVQKGDKLLVAQGQYPINSPSELLALSDSLNPVYGGYSTIDNYLQQNSDINVTTLLGVPLKYKAIAQAQGFHPIVDGKSVTFNLALKQAEQQLAEMQRRQSATDCKDGKAGIFSCNGVAMISHVPLSEFGSGEGSDIWGHVDLNSGIEYALMTFNDGIAVISLADPKQPIIIKKVPQKRTIWRDVKVLQTYNRSLRRWQAWAYLTADSSTEGLKILDLNNLPNDVTIANSDFTDRSAHNVYISNVDYGLNIPVNGEPGLHILGANNVSGAMRTYSVKDPINPVAEYTPTNASANQYSHDATSLWIDDSRAQVQCGERRGKGCNLMLDFNEDEVRLWNHTDIENSEPLSRFTYNTASYVHSGWWSEDKQYVFVQDELDERNRALNSTLYVYDISDLQNPVRVGTWTGPTRAIDHNGFVRGNRYYLANYERGLTVLDISEPTTPQTIGYFDTYPLGDRSNFNGAWGVYPFLPSGIILVSDINSGLFVLKDNTRSGDISFAEKALTVEEGSSVEITVNNQFHQRTSVDYQVFNGSASNTDYAMSSGTLSWGANEQTNQQIKLTALSDNIDEPVESVFVRLANPRNGATLSDSSLVQIDIKPKPVLPDVSFVQEQITVLENQGQVEIELTRKGNTSVAASIDYQWLIDGDDIQVTSNNVKWSAGDTSNKVITLKLANDNLTEETESYQLQLLANGRQLTGNKTRITIHIRDDDSNQAPILELSQLPPQLPGTAVRITATGTDPEGDVLQWKWQQVKGPSVTLNDTIGQSIDFVMPNGGIELQVQVSDDFGKTTQKNLVIVDTPIAAPPPPPSDEPKTKT